MDRFFQTARKWIIRILRLIARVSPFSRGKRRLAILAARLLGSVEEVYEIRVKNNRTRRNALVVLRFPEDIAYSELLITGFIEKGTMKFFEFFVQNDDIIFDVGANIGYMSLSFAVGAPNGEVHSFEPTPTTFLRFKDNLEHNRAVNNVRANAVAVIDHPGSVTLKTFVNRHHGFSSIFSSGETGIVHHEVKAITLDDYVVTNNIAGVDIIKIDVEGAEQKVIDGAKKVIQKYSPTIVMEANEEAAALSGYRCADLLHVIDGLGTYRFFRCPLAHGDMRRMRSLDDFDSGDNVVAVHERHWNRLDTIQGKRMTV